MSCLPIVPCQLLTRTRHSSALGLQVPCAHWIPGGGRVICRGPNAALFYARWLPSNICICLRPFASRCHDKPHVDPQMICWDRPGCGWPHTAAKSLWRSPGPAFAQVLLLLACTALQLTDAEARALTANTSIPRSFERRSSLEAIALSAGNGNEGWTLGRASYDIPPDSFTSQLNLHKNKTDLAHCDTITILVMCMHHSLGLLSRDAWLLRDACPITQ